MLGKAIESAVTLKIINWDRLTDLFNSKGSPEEVTHMRESAMVRFEVQEGKLDEAKAAIQEFISNIREKEARTLYYSSYQENENLLRFVHFMIFADSDSHQHHRSTEYVRNFVSKLYPVCIKEPQPTFLSEFAACGFAHDAVTKTT